MTIPACKVLYAIELAGGGDTASFWMCPRLLTFQKVSNLRHKRPRLGFFPSRFPPMR